MLRQSHDPGWYFHRFGMLRVVQLCLIATISLSMVPWSFADDSFSYNPVQNLRLILQAPVRDNSAESGELELRRRGLQERMASICRAPDLRDALLLQEWRDEDADEQIANIDGAIRTEIAHRFVSVLRDTLQSGDGSSRLAAAHMICEVADGLRTKTPLAGIFRELTPVLADLCRRKDTPVQEAAAQALGRIEADSTVGMPALTFLFEAKEVLLRRAAAEAFGNVLHALGQNVRLPGGGLREGARNEIVQVGRAVLSVVSGGLGDPDAEVRQLSVDALHQMSLLLGNAIGDPRSVQGLTPAEMQDYRQEVQREESDLWPLVNEIKDQTSGLANALNDNEPTVRREASQALEELGTACQKLQTRRAGIPEMAQATTGTDATRDGAFTAAHESGYQKSAEPLLDRLHATLPALVKELNDPDAENRRAAIDALEILGDQATPAIPSLIASLSDRDVFVRWAAARTLGKTGKGHAAEIVPALARALDDADLDVRLIATDAIKQFGPEAGSALAVLTFHTSKGDTVERLAAMQALESMGLAAGPAIPQLAGALKAPDARVREGAARLLAKFGPAAQPAEPALRQAMADNDFTVRKAAGDALLKILPPPGISSSTALQHVGYATPTQPAPVPVPTTKVATGELTQTSAWEEPPTLTEIPTIDQESPAGLPADTAPSATAERQTSPPLSAPEIPVLHFTLSPPLIWHGSTSGQ